MASGIIYFITFAFFTTVSVSAQDNGTECPPNSVYYPECSPSFCADSCDQAVAPGACPVIVGCYPPRCVCMTGYLRDGNGNCVRIAGCFEDNK